MVRFGVCGSIDSMLSLASYSGADYLETSASDIASMSPEKFAAALETVKSASIPVDRFNCLFPGSFRLLDDSPENMEKIRSYLQCLFPRLKALGGEIAVFGSGSARKRSEDMDQETAFSRLVNVTGIIGKAAEEHGMQIAIEPLRHAETNMVNTVKEADRLAKAVDMENVQILADSYHMESEGESMEDGAAKSIIHVHVASYDGRKYPNALNLGQIPALFRALKSRNYTGSVSIEGTSESPASELRQSIAILRIVYGK